MAVAQGSCPNCGAPIEFAVGSSIAKVCEHCRHTVVRSDRGLSHLGRVADLVDTPALVAIGDEGSLAGRPFRVMGRVQLDHGKGPWDEYYVAFDHGQRWGWLAYAQGSWYATEPVSGIPAPGYADLYPELDVPLGPAGVFRVAEVRTGRITSAEGELPGVFAVGFERHYADLHGAANAFATLDYGDGSGVAAVYLGWVFTESAFNVTALGPRSTHKVKATTLRCPNCGGDVPALGGERTERLGCPYCGALSDIAEQKVVALQEKAREAPAIPIGSTGALEGSTYVCTALVRRSSSFDGELYEWEEFLLWNQGIGFRWLVKDPETGWSFVEPVNLAELDLGYMPRHVTHQRRRYARRNQNMARVEYVLGEIYWKCEVGETTQVSDFVEGKLVLSREAGDREVNWSASRPLPRSLVATAFGLSMDKVGGEPVRTSGGTPPLQVILFIVLFVLIIGVSLALESLDGTSVGVGTGTYRGGGSYSGGK